MTAAETVAGDRVAFDRDGSGPGLVFVAGAGPARATDPVTTATARAVARQGVTTVVFDRLGRGESTADGVLDLDRELGAIAAMIDEAGGAAVICGHSSGCALALLAADRGLPVAGLVLWEAPIAGDPARIAAWADDFERLLDVGDLEAAQVHYMQDMPPEWLDRARSSPIWPRMVAQAPSLRADAQALRAVTGDAALLGRVRVPVLTAAGTETLPEMLASSALIAEQVPGARAERIPGAHHQWEPAAMATRLAAFVHEVAGR